MALPSPLSPHHRHHQSSLEGITDFQTEAPLDPDARDRARHRFYHIAHHFDDQAPVLTGNIAARGGGASPRYNRAQLIRLTYDHACSPLSQDNYLRAFFTSLELSMDGNEALDERVQDKFFGFADYLFNNFFLPLKASATKTPQPSPAYHSAISKLQSEAGFISTPERLSALRGVCLIRDHHRCVVTRRFDRSEAINRFENADDNAEDDDGNLLDQEQFEALEVAHILPHSLTRLGRGEELVLGPNSL
ncbi:hypothetical protein F5144DRAFT_328310 [Chaetomium tenue]|uniref:Uncharacterized protein n=1 Tax=Chaetomium tenue TaxID=1854479 RepID=A0ACB7P5K1_9PEZI|nr:hypothetical protein F5144DRAFT_328310 [Chaetomium globosum]